MYKTGYHAKYLANQIILKESFYKQSSIKRTIYDSSIQLNPHQVEAALFALRSPNDKGVILADEVGLGKTIEAGLVIAQSWSEMKQKILIIAPNPLMKQWQAELRDKFTLESEIIDTQNFKKIANKGINPFDQDKILITSYGLAKNKADYIARTFFNLAVLDEAHKIRSKKTMHNEIKQALKGVKKVLLTATPIQNCVEDLYNLCSFIDDEAFNDKRSFDYLCRNHHDSLKDAVKTFVQRTLRKQVEDYVKYPNRIVRTYDFTLTNEELRLYHAVTEYLRNESLYLFKNNRNKLIAITIYKQMASSTAALISTLEKIKNRLKKIYNKEISSSFDIDDWKEELGEDYEDYEAEEDLFCNNNNLHEFDIVSESILIQEEIKVIQRLIKMANAISEDSRAVKLASVLNEIFKGLSQQKGANKKVLIFTESVKTQNYLYDFLKRNGFKKTIRFSGQNNTDECREIYEKWKLKHTFSEAKSTAMREALVDEFKNRAEIMIATEAGSEGLNLQFCSAIINYDLPWNPQRIEQRIGRCHRFGQPVDVTVFNFINQSNRVEKRMYELLNDKFNLFDGIFNSSDTILGLLDQGNNLEKKISDIYSLCRTNEEVDQAFQELQEISKPKINKKLKETKETIATFFDEDVVSRFKANEKELKQQLTELEESFWELSKIQLQEYACFSNMEEDFKFALLQEFENSPKGIYQLHTHFDTEKEEDVILYRTNSDLGKRIIHSALSFNQNLDYIEFDLTNYEGNISGLNRYKGLRGYLNVTKIKTKGIVDQERLLVKGVLEDYQSIPEPLLKRLLNVNGSIQSNPFSNPFLLQKLQSDISENVKKEVELINQENNEVYKTKKEQLINESKTQRNVLKGIEEEYEIRREEIEVKLIETFEPDEVEKLQKELDQIEQELERCRLNKGLKDKEIRDRRTKKLNELRKKLQYETEEIFTIRFKII